MGSYTVTGAPVKIIIPGSSQKSQVELPKIKLQLNKQQNAMVRLPCSTGSVVSSQSRISQQQVQKIQQLQQVQQLQKVNLPQVQQVQQVNLTQQHLAQKLTQSQVFEEQKELHEAQYCTDQQVPLEKTVTFADVHYDQYGRWSPTHGSTVSGRSTPTQTSSGRSSPAQTIHGDQTASVVRQRRSSGNGSPIQNIQGDQPTDVVRQRRISESSSSVQSLQGDQSTAVVRQRRISESSSSVQSLQGDQPTALMMQRRSSGSCSPVQSMQGDQSTALVTHRRPSITQLIVHRPQQQIVPKLQAHKIKEPTNKRKASLTPIQPNNMQLAIPIVLSNHQQKPMVFQKKQVEYQQMPMGYKAARKTSIPGQIVIKLFLK